MHSNRAFLVVSVILARSARLLTDDNLSTKIVGELTLYKDSNYYRNSILNRLQGGTGLPRNFSTYPSPSPSPNTSLFSFSFTII